MTLTTLPFHDVQTGDLPGLAAQVGDTPLLTLSRLSLRLGLPPFIRVFAKAEWFNPGGSVKDRPAREILRHALASGQLTPGKRLLDSTSGNMGIAYATLGASLGIPVTLAMPANASPERIRILRALGVDLVLTDSLEGSDGAMQVARRMAAEQPNLYWYANQYDNPDNWGAHYRTTGPETWAQTDGQVTHFIAGLGTSGTLTGVGRYLRAMNPAVQIIAVQPDAPFHGLEGLKHMASSHRPGIYDPAFPDRMIEVSTEEAREMVRLLAHEEGLFVGISSGAAAVAVFRIAKELALNGCQSALLATIFPDAGYKYLSDTALWEGL
ncbi:MAG: cysteine synthase family protein [Anaerolineales bacterium]